MEEAVYKVEAQDGHAVYLAVWFSDNPAESENCDACIGYEIYDTDTLESEDGGEMDYNEAEKGYRDIKDALADVLDFALDLKDAGKAVLTDLGRIDLEDQDWRRT